MNYAFKCSNSIKDIENPTVFNNLFGDELSELLCEDFNYINWFTVSQLTNLTTFDMCTVLSVHPEFIGLFMNKLHRGTKRKKDPLILSQWLWVIESQPKLRIYTDVIFDESL